MPYAQYPIFYATCPMGNISHDFFRFFRNFEITKLFGKKSPVFFLLFWDFEVMKLFGEKISRFLCYYQISKHQNYLDNIFYHLELQESRLPKITKLRNYLEINLPILLLFRNYDETIWKKLYALCPMSYAL